MSETELDRGTGYGRPKPHSNKRLTEVGSGTPMGELMRRFWQPVAKSTDATATPKRVRILGEDLVLFRDGHGRPGLVVEHCCHRGTSLFYGRVEDDGIRCCYHGWKFDVKGNCLDRATEVDGGARREATRQPWYPVQERYGLVFAYMGPPQKKPVLPRWAILEDLKPGEFVEVGDYLHGPSDIVDCSWLQAYENNIDQVHGIWLHGCHAGPQIIFDAALPGLSAGPAPHAHGAVLGFQWRPTEHGVVAIASQPAGDKILRFVFEVLVPNMASIPGALDFNWFVPVDDTHHKTFVAAVVKEPGTLEERNITHNRKTWKECTPEELQKTPGDYEAQRSQGDIAFHSEEHLSITDQGIVMLRRALNKMLDDLEAGTDPHGVSFDPNETPRNVTGPLAPVPASTLEQL